jgi:hypothetical protein
MDRTREDKWFLENEKHLVEAARLAREKRAAERAAREKEEERRRLRDLHFMKCPKCGHDMKEEVVQGVALDRCTFCEGIYCDAGELEAEFLRRSGENRGFLGKLIGL